MRCMRRSARPNRQGARSRRNEERVGAAGVSSVRGEASASRPLSGLLLSSVPALGLRGCEAPVRSERPVSPVRSSSRRSALRPRPLVVPGLCSRLVVVHRSRDASRALCTARARAEVDWAMVVLERDRRSASDWKANESPRGTWFPLPVSGTWVIGVRTMAGARVMVHVCCPDCGRVCYLAHDIGPDGTLHPSLVCPHQGCTWHVMARLADWPGP